MKNKEELEKEFNNKLDQLRNEFNQQIKELECKPKFEVGDYIITHLKSVAVITEINDDGVRWDDVLSSGYRNGQTYFKSICKATNKEVEDALKAESIKKGYKIGVKVKCLFDGQTRELCDYDLKTPTINIDCANSFNLGTSVIMRDGI
jgi:phage FluMu gp28-like protein